MPARPLKVRYLCFDPAERTHAYSVLDITVGAQVSVTCVHSALLHPQATIVNLTHNDGAVYGDWTQRPLEVELRAYDRLIRGLYRQWQPARVGTERFQIRGTANGKTIETVGMMNGLILLAAQSARIPYTLYMPVTWKGWANRILPPPPVQRKGKAVKGQHPNLATAYHVGELRQLTHHSVDTAIMCLWLAAKDNPEHASLFTAGVLLNAVRNLRVA